MTQLTIYAALAARGAALESVTTNAGAVFVEQASRYVMAYLREYGPTPGEDLSEACVKVGIVPHDLKAFGQVYMRLSRAGKIEKCGMVPRRRGHMTTGGNVWRVT